MYLHSMNTQRATKKNVLTANFFEKDFSYRTLPREILANIFLVLANIFLVSHILLLFHSPKGS